jgi:hypothetical protein
LCFRQRDADAGAEELVRRVLVQALRRVEEVAALLGQVVERGGGEGLAVQLEVVGETEVARALLDHLGRVEVQRVHVLVEHVVRKGVELAPLVAVRLVRERGTHHPEGDLLAVDRDGQLRLELGELLRMFARQIAEVALAREAPQLPHARAAVDGEADRLHLLELGEVLVPLVDRRQVERVLQTRVVEVELLVQLRDEAVGLFAVGVELAVRGRGRRHR